MIFHQPAALFAPRIGDSIRNRLPPPPKNRHRWIHARLAFALALLALLPGCDFAYPEVVVVNKTSAQIQLRNLSFNGCAWSTVLTYGQATTPERCLPGSDRVHFERLNLADNATTWFSYQTLTMHQVNYHDFRVFEITTDDMEQDFCVPGPYGH